MKYFFLFILTILLPWSTLMVVKKSNVTIYLQMDSTLCTEKQWIYMFYLQGNDIFLEDSAQVSPYNSNVTLRGWIADEQEMQIIFSQKGPNQLFINASPNDTIHVNIGEKDGIGMVWKEVLGSHATNEKAKYRNLQKKIQLKLFELENSLFSVIKGDSIELQNMQDTIIMLKDSLKNISLAIIENSRSPHNVWSALLDSHLTRAIGIDSVLTLTKKSQERFPKYQNLTELYSNTTFPPSSKASIQARKRRSEILSTKSQKIKNNKYQKRSNIIPENKKVSILPSIRGEYALFHFTLEDTNKNKIALEQMINKNKYILIDFWASWCIPCLESMGLLKRIYNHYHDYLSICTISLDINKDYWKNAIKRHQIEMFTNLIATKDGIINENIERLNITKIPRNYLLSPNGEIIAVNIFGDSLVNKIQELLPLTKQK